MSEKEKVMEEEEEIVDHWSHEHPLVLVETRRGDSCYGCEQQFSREEKAYGCGTNKCGYKNLLHEECAETARMIRHQQHPLHMLIQQHEKYMWRCAICEKIIWSIGYKCTSTRCGFQMHTRCAQAGGGMMEAAADEEDHDVAINHPSHPKHKLRLFGKFSSFKCAACGTTRRGKSYICTACRYWIHERCASLPQTIQREDHHHPLSLSFHVPLEYIKFDYKCDACNKYLLPNYWIYHCQLCRYIVHIKCVFKKSSHTTIINANASNWKDIIHLPANEVAEELITPFVMRQEGGGAIPHSHDGGEMVINVKYKFDHHQHQLTFISSSSSSSSSQHDENQEEEENEEDYGKRSEKLICDGCITPILTSSSSYMSCSNEYCKYYLHMACFHLPSQLPSLPFHHEDEDDHQLHLQSGVKPWEWIYCSVCGRISNGLFYACKKCDFRVDIKCASMPETIHHAAHPQHPLKHVRKEDIERDTYSRQLSCVAGCDTYIYRYDCYTCYDCDFVVHIGCAVLAASVTSRRWDKHHPLPLTYNANLNHPDDFYCDQCETEMNPKSWMYHCRHCDLSFHPKCFPLKSGWARNFKFGQSVKALAHPHPLTYQLLTTKHHCDVCHENKHECGGFHCALCNFFICYLDCGREMDRNGNIEALI